MCTSDAVLSEALAVTKLHRVVIEHPMLTHFVQVTEGCGRVLVLAVGVNSEWGKTMAMCQSEPGETPLQQQLEKMAGGIAKLGLGVAVVCFVVLMLRCAHQRTLTSTRRRCCLLCGPHAEVCSSKNHDINKGTSCSIAHKEVSSTCEFNIQKEKKKEKSMPLGVTTGASVPRSSPRHTQHT